MVQAVPQALVGTVRLALMGRLAVRPHLEQSYTHTVEAEEAVGKPQTLPEEEAEDGLLLVEPEQLALQMEGTLLEDPVITMRPVEAEAKPPPRSAVVPLKAEAAEEDKPLRAVQPVQPVVVPCEGEAVAEQAVL